MKLPSSFLLWKFKNHRLLLCGHVFMSVEISVACQMAIFENVKNSTEIYYICQFPTPNKSDNCKYLFSDPARCKVIKILLINIRGILKDNLVDSVGLPYYEYMNFQRLT